MARVATNPSPGRRPRGQGPVAPIRGDQLLRDAAYVAIKHRVITGALKPGEYVNELQLAATLRIGRTPVHHAIDRLVFERLVEVIPNKGIIGKPLRLNEVLEIIDIRLVNEGHCARLAAEGASDDDIVALGQILARAMLFAARRNIEQIMLLDREFHLRLARVGGNALFEDLLRNLIERSMRFWPISLNAPGHLEGVGDEHCAILQALRQRQPDAAERAMRTHIQSFRETLLHNVEQGRGP